MARLHAAVCRSRRALWWRGFGALLVALALLGFPAASHSQQAGSVSIGYVYPAGVRRGTELQVTVGGQSLKGVKRAFVSGGGVDTAVVSYNEPLSRKEAQQLQMQLQALEKRKRAAMEAEKRRGNKGAAASAQAPGWGAEDERMLAALRAKLAKNAKVRKPASPAIADTILVRITAAADAELGEREIRLATDTALSNPLVFCVDRLPEIAEDAAATSPETPPPKKPEYRGQAPPPEFPAEIPSLPVIVNGQITAKGVDRYRFVAHKGQRLVFAAGARSLIPYIADAVPGWFQAALILYDARGREVAFDDDFHFRPDPVLSYEIPADGAYVMEIRDALYRGREDFVYRIVIGELPFLTGLFPLGGRVGTTTDVALRGWNLPANMMTVGAAETEPGLHPISVRRGETASNAEPFALDSLPESPEKEPNSTARPQRVSLPIIINGRIDPPGDSDAFVFEGRAGQGVAAEVLARRLDSPLDAVLELTDPSGGRVAFNDDFEDRGRGLDTHHADSFVMAKLPSDGVYRLRLCDVQGKGGPDFGYRLRMSSPRPDFALRVVPSGLGIAAGATVPITVYAMRKDGFSGEIDLAFADAPEGLVLGGGRIPAGEDRVRITLTAPPNAVPEPVNLRIVGRAAIDGRDVVHSAVPADDRMQAFEYRHLVPAKEFKVVVSGKAGGKAGPQILGEMPLAIPVGGIAQIRFGGAPGVVLPRGQLECDEPPEGVTIEKITYSRAGAEIAIRADPAKLKPGREGNLIFSTFGGSRVAGRARVPLATLPAIPFRIVSGAPL